jgi:acylphosphatase
MPRLLVVVRGRVQGVGFRYFVLKRARERGLKGQVRNRPDGAVEAEAEGARQALESWLEQLRLGPTGARVEGIRETWSEEQGSRFEGFDIVG